MLTQGQSGSGKGKALAIGAGLLIGGLLLFSGGSASAGGPVTPSTDQQCKDLAAKAAPLLLSATKADIPALTALLASVTALGGCGTLGDQLAKKIADLGVVVVVPPPVKTSTSYIVVSGDTPASVASRFGITADKLMSGLNGYGHGENGTKDNAPYPYSSQMFSFATTVPEAMSNLPVGTTFTPTWRAGHGIDRRPIFKSSVARSDGQRYWWFSTGAGATSLPLPYAPNDAGFGLIYSDGGLFLVGPWYSGLVLVTPSHKIAGEESPMSTSTKDPLCTSCGSEMTTSVEGCVACGTKPSAKIAEALREEAIAERAANGFGGGGFGGGGAGIMGENASVGGFTPMEKFGRLTFGGAPIVVTPDRTFVPDPTGTDYDSGYKLAQEDVRRVRAGSVVYVAPFVWTAGTEYWNGYKAGIAASGGVLLDPIAGRTQVVVPTSGYVPPSGFGGGRAAGKGYIRGEGSPAQDRAIDSLDALRSAVSGELSGLIDAAQSVIAQGKPINLMQVPVVPGSEPIIECLRSFNAEIGSDQASVGAVYGGRFARPVAPYPPGPVWWSNEKFAQPVVVPTLAFDGTCGTLSAFPDVGVTGLPEPLKTNISKALNRALCATKFAMPTQVGPRPSPGSGAMRAPADPDAPVAIVAIFGATGEWGDSELLAASNLIRQLLNCGQVVASQQIWDAMVLGKAPAGWPAQPPCSATPMNPPWVAFPENGSSPLFGSRQFGQGRR